MISITSKSHYLNQPQTKEDKKRLRRLHIGNEYNGQLQQIQNEGNIDYQPFGFLQKLVEPRYDFPFLQSKYYILNIVNTNKYLERRISYSFPTTIFYAPRKMRGYKK